MLDLLKTLFLRCSKNEMAAKTGGKIFTVRFGPALQSIGRDGRLSREGALDVRESREQRNKIVPIFSPEKQEKRAILAA
tara:strand:+ start:171 stop:407 length:237 start_codon:yes stop_codon:yes gene_type:complete